MSNQDNKSPAGSGSSILEAPNILEFPFSRSTGPVIGEFMTRLRAGEIVGAKTKSGKVIVPPTEYDPETGEDIEGLVPVASTGVITTWCWVASPTSKHPMDSPFGWALIQLDGADTAMLHCVKANSASELSVGKKVVARFAENRVGHIKDISYFELQGGN